MGRIPSIYPLVNKVIEPHVMSAGKFIGSQPMGVTVHHTADRNIDRVVAEGLRTRIGYHLIIDRNGSIVQTGYLENRVNHAGNAMWNGKSPNKFHAAVAVVGWGDVQPGKDNFITWTKSTIPSSEVAHRRGNLGKELHYWDTATPEQLASLDQLLRWFISLGISVKDICGHDECALPVGRKVDPGGTLPMTMDEYRLTLEGLQIK